MGLALSNHLGPMTGGILDASFGSGTPPGRVGLWTNAAGASFDHFAITPNKPLDLAGRWQDYAFRYQTPGGDANGITAGDQMQRTSQEQGTSRAAFVKGVHSENFEIRFTLEDHTVGLAFAGLDGYNWNMVKLSRDKDSPVPFAMREGVLSSSGLTGTYTAANYKFIAAGTPRPFKVTYDGTTLSVFTGANPGDVDNWAAAYTTTSYSPTGGVLLGFVTSAEPGEVTWVDDLSIKLDTDGNGSYDSTETIEHFTLDASGYAPQGVEYDAAGNIVYDGVHAFTFDAWNRLTKVHKAYKEATDNAGAVDLGSLIKGAQVQASKYDGQGRRIVRAVTNSGNLDATYHYYYSGEQLIETRNGSGAMLKQQVWGVGYIDELVQIAVNDDPTDSTESLAETRYWVTQDASFNVLSVVDAAGLLVERYTYSPYGRRTVYTSAGANDPDAYTPTLMSQRLVIGGVAQPYGLSEFGHQGLMHDEHIDLIHNRARVLHPVLERFMQRDPLGYVDGMSLYAGYHVMSGGVDPSGLSPNQQDAVDPAHVVYVIRQLEAKHPNESPYQIFDRFHAAVQSGRYWKYVYTVQHGWIDLGHFTAAAQYARKPFLPGWAVEAYADVVVEGLQDVAGVLTPWLEGRGSSAYDSEDFPSNEQGALFGTRLQELDLFSSVNKLSDYMAEFLATSMAVAPQMAPDFGGLPTSEDQHEKQWRAASRDYQGYAQIYSWIHGHRPLPTESKSGDLMSGPPGPGSASSSDSMGSSDGCD